ncbi:IclR family transcriptional regulator [Paenibacillus koleovorans]|uniref:IclR family transcriptional regulator n=1 Tax=Paenibacillus koleovorans TaxID=121608 RepID=UPI0013E30E69|nr:IclR family transcriptional regulator [Paenibacillus koleovorans]
MKKDTENTKNKYSVPALEKTFVILDHLAKTNRGISLSDLSSELGLPKTSVFSIMQTLESYNMIRKDSNGLFQLGLKLYSLGMSSLRNLNVKETFVPHLERLRDETHFTVHLVAYEKGETVCIEKIEGPGTIRFLSYVGERKRMNTSAVGKAVAAYLPESELQLVLSKGFSHLTPNSITNEHAFRGNLAQIREYGYAVDDEEGEIGVRCLGVPIFMEDGFLFGSVSVSTLKSNLPMQKFSDYSNTLIKVGEKLSRSLGYAGAYPLK